jgi:uncharacterized protein YjbJ (UPF0337 family)
MNSDQVKGMLQKVGGRIEESAGALVGSESLKLAGQEDQLKGEAREAWGRVKEAGDHLIDQAKAAKADAEIKSERARAFEHEHRVEVEGIDELDEPSDSSTAAQPVKPESQLPSEAERRSA